MNNAVYHGIFDSVINIFLIRHCGLDIQMGASSSKVGFMVTNKCQFFAPSKYPDIYLIGMKIPKIGKTSMSYQLGMFPMIDANANISANLTHGYFAEELGQLGDSFENLASCVGDSVHVFVNPQQNNNPTPIPNEWRTTLQKLQ